MMFYFLLLLLVLLKGSHVQGHGCNVTQSSQPKGSKVDCHDLHLTSVPSDLPRDTVWLDLTGNHLTSLFDFTFEHLPLLEHLDLTSNNISTLAKKTFTGLSMLRYLSLEHNKLKLDNESYPNDIFLPLWNLTLLNIGANDIDTDGQIPDHIFRHVPNLETLFIDSFSDTKFGPGFVHLTNLKTLNLTGWRDKEKYCSLQSLFNDTFDVFQASIIENLDLSHCHLSQLEADAFLPLRNISTIILTDNESIPIQNAFWSLIGLRGKNVTRLKFNRMFLTLTSDVDKQVLKANNLPSVNVCIENIDLRENKILYIDPGVVKTSVLGLCLRYLDLSGNMILGDVQFLKFLVTFPLLEYLDISRQQRFSKRPYESQTTHQAKPFTVILPHNLKIMNLSESFVCIGNLDDITILNAASLQVIEVADNGMSNLTNEVNGIKKIEYIDISGNNGSGISGQFIKSFPNLKHLLMNDIQLDDKALLSGSGFHDGLGSLFHLESIRMESNNIRYIEYNIFHRMAELSVISLANNKLDTVGINLTQLTKLTHIDLSLNSILYLKPDTLAVLDNLGKNGNFFLNLKRNPFYCSCETFYFIEWLFTTKVHLDSGGDYDCVTENGVMTTTGEVHVRFLYYWRRCQGRVWLSVALILMCLLLLVIMTWLALERNWTRIQHRLLMLLGRGVDLVRRQDFKKDAYVAHCEEDTHEVAEKLGHRLEDFGLKLILPYRDFLPGTFIAENIVESVDASWKTVMVVTEEFLLDPWSFFTMRTVSHSVSIHHPNRIILLLIGKVDRGRLLDCFVNIIDENKILELDDFPAEDNNVWVELRDMILD